MKKLFAILAVLLPFVALAQTSDSTPIASAGTSKQMPEKVQLWILGDHVKAFGRGSQVDVVDLRPDGNEVVGTVNLYNRKTADGCKPMGIPMRGTFTNDVLVMKDTVPASDNLACRFSFEVNLTTKKGRYDLGPGRPGDVTLQ